MIDQSKDIATVYKNGKSISNLSSFFFLFVRFHMLNETNNYRRKVKEIDKMDGIETQYYCYSSTNPIFDRKFINYEDYLEITGKQMSLTCPGQAHDHYKIAWIN